MIASLIPPIPVSLRLSSSGREAMALGVADVHPVELGGEQGRLLAAGAGPDLQDHVAIVVRVAREEQDLELLEQARLVGLEAVDLVAGHGPLVVRVARLSYFARAGELGARRLEPAERRDGGFEARQLPAEAAELGRGRRRPRGAPARPGDRRIGGRPRPAWRRGCSRPRRRVAERRVPAARRRQRLGLAARSAPISPARGGSRPNHSGSAHRRPRAPAPWRRSRPRSCRRSAAWW